MAIFQELKKTTRHLSKEHKHDLNAPILRVKNLTVSYESGVALEDISFELAPGERVAIVGPNGAGKSTLIKAIAGVLEPTSGKVEIFGHDPDGHICIAYVPQRTQVDWNFPVTVTDVAMMGRIGQMGLFRIPTAKDRKLVQNALDVVSMKHLAQRQISQLSGGQQQRMFIARALAQEAELILMDEPMTGLDVPSQDNIFEILDELRKDGVTVLVSLHDLQMASERFDKVILLNRNLLAIGPAEDALRTENLIHAYGGSLQLFPIEDGGVALKTTCCDDENDHTH